MPYSAEGLVRFYPVVYYKEWHHFPHIFRHNFVVIHQCPVKIIGNAFQWSPGKKIPFPCEKMVVNYIGYNTGIFMIFSGKKYLTAMNNGMTIGETINVPVQYNPFSDKIWIL
jgi:hypothetical protein